MEEEEFAKFFQSSEIKAEILGKREIDAEREVEINIKITLKKLKNKIKVSKTAPNNFLDKQIQLAVATLRSPNQKSPNNKTSSTCTIPYNLPVEHIHKLNKIEKSVYMSCV